MSSDDLANTTVIVDECSDAHSETSQCPYVKYQQILEHCSTEQIGGLELTVVWMK